MSRSIYISEFDSESKLKSEQSYSLPAAGLFSAQNRPLTEGMDALSLTMAEDGDAVVTYRRLPEEYLAYWSANICSAENFTPAESQDDSIYLRLLKDGSSHSMLMSGKIINYAHVPEYYEMCRGLGIRDDGPGLDVIRELNSKAYSNELRCRLGFPAAGIRLRSPEEYEAQIPLMLKSCGRVLIKDSMGVSGKGMLLIDSEGIAYRLADHFRRQQSAGRTDFDFILEPLLDRKADISCLFHIDGPGRTVIDGLRRNYSKGYAYLGSGPPDEDELALAAASDYTGKVMSIAADMAEKGYRGYACVDSLITQDDQLIPLIEINPRMSMSRFSLRLGLMLNADCRLGYTEGKCSGITDTAELLRQLDEQGILYTHKRGSGLIPLAPRTWDTTGAAGKRVRIYYAVIYRSQEGHEKILTSWLAHCSRSICAGPVT